MLPSSELASSALPPIPACASASQDSMAPDESDTAPHALLVTHKPSKPARASTLPWWIRLHVHARKGSMATDDTARRAQRVIRMLSYSDYVPRTRPPIPPYVAATRDTMAAEPTAHCAPHATRTQSQLPRVTTIRSPIRRSASVTRASLGMELCASPLAQEDIYPIIPITHVQMERIARPRVLPALKHASSAP
jgi:hypothetical protein